MSSSTFVRWGGMAAMVGGILWAVDWVLFTVGHGPTTCNQNLQVLGLRPDTWDRLLVVPLSLIAVGVVAVYSLQASRAGWLGSSGCVVSLVGLTLWIVGNLTGWPPGAIIILAFGMILFGDATLTAKVLPRWSRAIPLVLGVMLIPGFFLTFPGFVLHFPPFDSIYAFGLAGYFTHIAQELGRVLLGYVTWTEAAPLLRATRMR
jgi:hypothetical protein